MTSAKPVTLTPIAENNYEGPAPKPLAVVGGIPGAVDAQEAPVIDDSPADAAAVAADLQAVVDALIAAGVLTE